MDIYMLSLEQIKSVTFDRIVRGYRPEDVDDFIVQVAQQLEKLMAENKELENKVYILADSIEGYRNDEEALKAALINAQRLGESVIREANQKAEHILKEAKVKADRDFDIAMEKVHAEHIRLTRMQQEVAIFRSNVIEAYKKHIELLSNLPIDENTEHIPTNYFEKVDRDFKERQEADMQEATPTLTEPRDDMFIPPVAPPLTPPTAPTPPVQATAQPIAAPLVPPLSPEAIQMANLEPISTLVSNDNQVVSSFGFEQSLRPREATAELTVEEREQAVAKRNAAFATSEIGPIIPLMTEEEQEELIMNSVMSPPPQEEPKKAPVPTGRVSLFDHYDNFELE